MPTTGSTTFPALAPGSTGGGSSSGATETPGVRTVLLTADGDIDLTGGRARMISGARASAQIMGSRLSMGRGEWFRDLRKGVPWFQEILVHNPERGLLELILQEEALGTPGITAIESIELEHDRATRTTTATIAASTKQGGQVDLSKVKLRR